MSEFNFCETDIEKIKQEMADDYEATCGVKLYTGSPNWLFMNWLAYYLWQGNVATNEAAKQNLKKYAKDENLDAVIECIDGIERNDNAAAEVPLRFKLKEGEAYQVIPKDTRVTPDNTVIFVTKEDLIILAYNDEKTGALVNYGDVMAVCTSEGLIGNDFAAGTINKMLDYIPKIESVTNLETSSGGKVKESDAEYYERSIEESKRASVAGPLDAYESLSYAASSAVVNARAFGGDTETGADEDILIKLICNTERQDADEIINDVLSYITSKPVKPQTDLVKVELADKVEYTIEFEYGINTKNTQEAAHTLAAVDDTVEKYKTWQDSKIGRAINPTKLTNLLGEIGASNVKIINPQYTTLTEKQCAVFTGKVKATYTGVHDD